MKLTRCITLPLVSCLVSCFLPCSLAKNSPAPQFDPIAPAYRKTSGTMTIRKVIDDYSILHYLGDIRGKEIMDLGCGNGRYPRLFEEKGAQKIIGTDVSQRMIELAKKQSGDESRIRYFVRDAASIGSSLGQFDFVTAVFLLPNAKDEEHLYKMMATAYKSLKPGGTFIAIAENMQLANKKVNKGYTRKYGYEAVYRQPVKEGSFIDLTLYNADGTRVVFYVHHYSTSTYLTAARKAGFDTLEFLPLLVDPAAANSPDKGFWQAFLDHPTTLVMRAKRKT